MKFLILIKLYVSQLKNYWGDTLLYPGSTVIAFIYLMFDTFITVMVLVRNKVGTVKSIFIGNIKIYKNYYLKLCKSSHLRMISDKMLHF